MKIAVSGDLGSGKSVLCKGLADHFNCPVLSMGMLHREMAQKYNMDALEFSKYSETHPEIDHERDRLMVTLAAEQERLIIDSRMAWHFVPDVIKIHLIVNIEVAAKRVMNANRATEVYSSLDEAVRKLRERKQSENKRFYEFYGVDCSLYENYDLIIDTTTATPEAIQERVLLYLQNPIGNKSNLCLSTKNIFPTKPIHTVQQGDFTRSADESEPIRVFQCRGAFFIHDDHARVLAALRQGVELIPARLVASPRQWSFSPDTLREWEESNAFRFLHEPKAD